MPYVPGHGGGGGGGDAVWCGVVRCRWRGVVKAGSDIDRVARMHIENPNMPTIYHIFRQVQAL